MGLWNPMEMAAGDAEDDGSVLLNSQLGPNTKEEGSADRNETIP